MVSVANGTATSFTEAHFRSVVEGSLQGIIIQQEGRIVYANPAMARLFGYASEQEMIGLDPFEDLILDEDLTVFRERTSAVYKGARVSPHPGWRARHVGGKEVWLMSTAHVSEWQGRPAVASFYMDITERRRAEIASRTSEARYRSALQAGRMGAWETDLVAGTRLWSPEGLALFGLVLPGGKGKVGGADDEYVAAIHPDDRHLAAVYRRLADSVDSFPAEYRIVRPSGDVLWVAGRGQVVSRTPDGRAHRLVSIMADVTESRAMELQNRILVQEVAHRAKNLLAVVQSVARQTLAEASSLETFKTAFEGRLQGLSASQDLLTRGHWLGAPLADVVRDQITTFVEIGDGRVALSGPCMTLTSEAAQAVGMAIHELATNAAKYGALSNAEGRVLVSWGLTPCGERLELAWTEEDGPPVSPPARRGFGQVVLEQMIAGALGGSAALSFHHTGVRWRAQLPLCCLADDGSRTAAGGWRNGSARPSPALPR